MRLQSFIYKCIALFLAIVLPLSNSVSYAIPTTNSEIIAIPEDLGKIEESNAGTNDKTVIYIQDAHDSPEAQENIAKIINYAVEHYGVKTVFEEGYEGPVPTDQYFGFVKDPKLKEKISYFLMDKLRLGGAEYAHVNRKKDFRLIGADSINLHLENIRAYSESAKHKAETQKDLEAITKEIKRLTDQRFPKELKEWIKLKERFDEGELDLLDYLKRILTLNKDALIPPTIAILLNAATPQIISMAKDIDARKIFSEIDLLENDLATRYLTSERDKSCFRYYKGAELLKRLNDIRLSSAEYEFVKNSFQNLRTEDFARFIVQMTRSGFISHCK